MAGNSSIGANQAWLLGAPLTKIISSVVVVSFLLIHSSTVSPNKNHDNLQFDAYKILLEGQVYRLFSGPLAFATTGELFFGLLTLASWMRKFEREMGSRKFAMFLCIVGVQSTLLQLLFAQLYAFAFGWPTSTATTSAVGGYRHAGSRSSDESIDAWWSYSGPYAFLGAMSWLYHVYVPRMHPNFFGILGFSFSEKSIPYATMMIPAVFYRTSWSTILPFACGAFGAYTAIHVPALSLLEFPEVVVKLSEALGSRLVESPPGIMAPRQQQQQQQQQAVRRGGSGGPPTRPAVLQDRFEQLPPPSEETVSQLTAMGFERDAVLRALRESHNNVERAADRLLSGS